MLHKFIIAVAAVLMISGCAMNPKEQRALAGGGIGAGAGYLLGGTTGAVVGGLGGGILGAVTAPDEPRTVVNNNYYGPGRGHRRH